MLYAVTFQPELCIGPDGINHPYFTNWQKVVIVFRGLIRSGLIDPGFLNSWQNVNLNNDNNYSIFRIYSGKIGVDLVLIYAKFTTTLREQYKF